MKLSKIMKTAWLFVAVLLIFVTITTAPGLCTQPETVAIIPFSINSPQDLNFLQNGLFNMLFSRLSNPGKVDVLDREAVDKVMAVAQKASEIKGPLNESKARIIGANMGVDYILFGSLTHFEENVSLDASMVDISGKKLTLTFFEQSKSMGDVIPMVNTFAGDINLKVFNRNIANEQYIPQQEEQHPQEEQRPKEQQQERQSYGDKQTHSGFVNLEQNDMQGFQTYLKFKGQINAMAVGDVDNDGVIQVLVATDYEILIYKLKGSNLIVEKKLQYNHANRIISLDIADINLNGYPEIFVTSLNIHKNGLQSFVVEYNGNEYKTLTKNESFYYRVIDGQDNAKILLGQKSVGHPFKGDIYTLTESEKQYVTKRKLNMPRGTSVLSLAQGAVSAENKTEYVLVNEHRKLTIVNQTGKIDWESTEKYGTTGHYFLLPQEDIDGLSRDHIYFNQRILYYDIEADGKKEIFVVQNQELGGGILARYKRFTKGNIGILSWNGISLAPVLKTKPVQGWISDFAITDFDNDGISELLVVVIRKDKSSLLSTKKLSNIISYKLKE